MYKYNKTRTFILAAGMGMLFSAFFSLSIQDAGARTATHSISIHAATDSAITASPSQHLFTVTFQTNGGSAVAPISELESGTTIFLPANPVREGFWFRGWYLDKGCTKEFLTTQPITADTTLYAKWEEKENKTRDTITIPLTGTTPSTILCADFTGQQYGSHLQPGVTLLEPALVAEAVKHITGHSLPQYYAFRFEVSDFTFQESKPLPVTITLPNGYNADSTVVYFTPNGSTIDGMCQGTSLSDNQYQFCAYAAGIYIVMHKTNHPLTTEPTATPLTPSVSLELDSTVFLNAQTSANILFHNFDTTTTDPSTIVFRWKSSNSKIASVNKDGVITGHKTGTVTITATSVNQLYTASAKLKVKKKPIAIRTLSVSKTSYTLNKGRKQKLKIAIVPSNATNQTLRFVSSKPKVATVNKKGVILAKKAGTCTITLSTTDGSKITKKITLTVKS